MPRRSAGGNKILAGLLSGLSKGAGSMLAASGAGGGSAPMPQVGDDDYGPLGEVDLDFQGGAPSDASMRQLEELLRRFGR